MIILDKSHFLISTLFFKIAIILYDIHIVIQTAIQIINNKIVVNSMKKKQCLLNDIFQNKQSDPESSLNHNNIAKFVQCFSSSTGKRSRQIRILQIGGSCNTKIYKKSSIISSSIKKTPPSALLNNEILLRSYAHQNKQKNLFIEGIQRNQYQNIQKEGSINPNDLNHKRKVSFLQKNYPISPTSPQRSKGWSIRNKNVEQLPKKFYIMNQNQHKNNSLSPEKQQSYEVLENGGMNKSTKSVNILDKMKAIEDFSQSCGPDKECQSATVQMRRKPNKQLNKKNPQELAQQERKTKLQIKRQISLDYAKPFNPPTNISAFAYIVFEPKFSNNNEKKRMYEKMLTGGLFSGTQQLARYQNQKKFPHSHKILVSVNSRTQLQVASLTKIMTCILTVDLCQKFKKNSIDQKILIGKFESDIGGTTAQISPGEIYTLEDLYHGLMLPSGNDASVAIAVWGGRLLLEIQQYNNNTTYKKKQCYNRFISEMNLLAKKLGMQKTTYANSHGLVNIENKSCAYDLCILCEYAMSNKKFKKIVSTKIYSSTISYISKQTTNMTQSSINSPLKSQKYINSSEKQDLEDEIEQGEDIDLDSNQQQYNKEQQTQIDFKKVQWQNTHKFLHQKPSQYLGIKTGITNTAGPCLASCVKTESNRYFIIIVLNCDKMSVRYKDTQILKKWAFQREGLASPKKRKRCPIEGIQMDLEEDTKMNTIRD